MLLKDYIHIANGSYCLALQFHWINVVFQKKEMSI